MHVLFSLDFWIEIIFPSEICQSSLFLGGGPNLKNFMSWSLSEYNFNGWPPRLIYELLHPFFFFFFGCQWFVRLSWQSNTGFYYSLQDTYWYSAINICRFAWFRQRWKLWILSDLVQTALLPSVVREVWIQFPNYRVPAQSHKCD